MVAAVVERLIHLTTEGVEGRDGTTLFGWEEEETVVEAGTAACGALLAIIVRCHRMEKWLLLTIKVAQRRSPVVLCFQRARRTSRTMSFRRKRGREKRSSCCCSRRSRTRKPP